MSRIAAERPQSVSVVGPTQTGKSSLINCLFDLAAQEEYLDDPSMYVLLPLRMQYDTPATPEAFFERVRLALGYAGVERMSPDYDGFSDVVCNLMSEERRMILFLDDFGEVTKNEGFPFDFFSFMRSIANSYDVGYLTTLSRPLHTLCHTQDIEESPFFNIFTMVNLEPFSDKEARRLVTEPAAVAGQDFAEEVEQILGLAGRHPYLLQVASSLAFEARGNGEALNEDTLAERAFDISRPYLQRIWAELSESERQVLAAVSAGTPIDRRDQYAMESLQRYGLLQAGDDGPGFAAALVKRCAQEGDGAKKKGFLQRLFGG